MKLLPTLLKPVCLQAVRCIALCLMLASPLVQAQAPGSRNIIMLDPAHGGQDHGATLGSTPEKDLTLVLAANLRASLAARGLIVLTTRDADLPATLPVLTTDQRASYANHLHPAACILIHAAPVGNGILIATSALPAPTLPPEPSTPIAWDAAQSAFLSQSVHLANTLGLALVQAHLPVLVTRAALRPLDNLTCPAIAIEVSPLRAGSRSTSVSDAGYQRRIAEVLAAAILAWHNRTPANPPGATP